MEQKDLGIKPIDYMYFNIPSSGDIEYDKMKTDLTWEGEYIKGESWCRGSNLKIKSKYGRIYEQERGWNYEDGLYNIWKIDEKIIRATTPESLLEIIKKMKKMDPKISVQPSEEKEQRVMKSLWVAYENDYYDEDLHDGRFIIEFYADNDVEIMENIIKELEAVIEYGKKHDRHFQWI